MLLASEKYDALLKTVDRDCKVLQSFGIMDYSLLVGIHNMDMLIREKTGVRLKSTCISISVVDIQCMCEPTKCCYQQLVRRLLMGVPHSLAKFSICYCILHFGY